MLLNLLMEAVSNSGIELPGSSDIDGQLRKMMEKKVELMVISAVEKLIVPVFESLIRKVVQEEIQSALMTQGNGNRTHEATMSTECRTLQLNFLDEVSLPVLTGKKIEGKGGTAMRLAIIDNTTGQLVNSGPEASGKVEILLLQADDDDNEHNWSTEDFNNKIIRESDKEKPHVAKGTYVRLKEGVANLSDVKLGHGSSWKKRCSCRLGARFVDNSIGRRVKEAWTKSFMVEDRRGKLYGKHHPPFLSDAVWRLEKIGKDGKRIKRLSEENIKTVQDFLFSLSVDPQKLKRVFGGSKEWEATVEHARTCIIDDKKIYLYSSPSKFNFVVAFDAVGQLMGIVRNSHYVHLDNLFEVEQASARELLLLAFANREDITYVDDETSLVHQFPHESHGIGVATDSVRNDEYAPTEPDTSSPTIGPSMCPSNNFSLIGSERMQVIRDPSLPAPYQGPSSSTSAFGSNQALCDPSSIVPYQGLIHSPDGPVYSPDNFDIYQALSNLLPNPYILFEQLFGRESMAPLFFHHNNNHSETCVESCPGQQSNTGSERMQQIVDPSLPVPDQGPSSSTCALGSNQALGDPSLAVPDQGPSSSVMAFGSYQALCDPYLTVPEQMRVSRVRKRVLGVRDFDVQKSQRIS